MGASAQRVLDRLPQRVLRDGEDGALEDDEHDKQQQNGLSRHAKARLPEGMIVSA
jgi:hypothetical protein